MKFIICAVFIIPLFALIWHEMCIQDKKVKAYDRALDEEKI